MYQLIDCDLLVSFPHVLVVVFFSRLSHIIKRMEPYPSCRNLVLKHRVQRLHGYTMNANTSLGASQEVVTVSRCVGHLLVLLQGTRQCPAMCQRLPSRVSDQAWVSTITSVVFSTQLWKNTYVRWSIQVASEWSCAENLRNWTHSWRTCCVTT